MCLDRKELIGSLEDIKAELIANQWWDSDSEYDIDYGAARVEAPPPVEHQADQDLLRASPLEKLRRTHPLFKVDFYALFPYFNPSVNSSVRYESSKKCSSTSGPSTKRGGGG